MTPSQRVEPVKQVPAQVAAAYRAHIDYRRRATLLMWLAFLITFGVLRGITYGIRYHVLPLHDIVTSGGLHIHHFVWGIFLILGVGFVGLTSDAPRWDPWLAAVFGVGAALVIDEFAIWLNLRDVYWAQQGRSSVDLAIAVAALLGLYVAGQRFWRDVWHELRLAVRVLVGGQAALLRHRRHQGPRGDGEPPG